MHIRFGNRYFNLSIGDYILARHVVFEDFFTI